MKKQFIISALVVFAFTAFLLPSCSKEPDLTIEQDYYVDPVPDFLNDFGNVSVKQGVLSFKNINDFKRFRNFVFQNQKDVDFLINFLNENFGFTSLREVYENTLKLADRPNEFIKTAESLPYVFEKIADGNEFFFDLAVSNISSYYLNSEGKVIIGDTLVLDRNNGTYLFGVGDIIGDSDFDLDLVLDSAPDRFVPKYKGDGVLKNQLIYRTAYFSNSRRIVARTYFYTIYLPGIGITYEYQAQTTAQRRILGAWIQDRISSIGFFHGTGVVTYQFAGPVTIQPFDYFEINRADIRRTLVIAYFPDPIIHSLSNLILTHYGTWDRFGYRAIPQIQLFMR